MSKADPSFTSADPTSASMRGSNQTGVRDHNERLVLSILRREGALSKADIARMTGLSAQTVSVIMRELEADGMLLRDAPRRGRVGQPSVPMRLNPEGAYFHGVLVGRRWVEHVITDMCGAVKYRSQDIYECPDFDALLRFCEVSFKEGVAGLSPDAQSRIAGAGLAIPGHIWEWSDDLGMDREKLLPWRDRDFRTELAQRTGYTILSQNDASSACAAEMVFGTSTNLPSTFLHVFVGYFIGGGLVLDNRLFTGPSGNAAAIGSMPIMQTDGTIAQLIDVASLHGLTRRVLAAGKERQRLFSADMEWGGLEDEIEDWIKELAPALAQAVATAISLIDVPLVIIDGHMPETVRERVPHAVNKALDKIDCAGLVRPDIKSGTIGPLARTLGAASLPLADQFLV